MLMALLYCEADRIGAAAFACDQMPYGDDFWRTVFQGKIELGSIFETAYVAVGKIELCNQLLQIGLSDDLDGQALATEVEHSFAPAYVSKAA